MNEQRDPIIGAVEKVDRTVEGVVATTDRVVESYRKTAFTKFPILFLLLVTFGVTATLFGFERMIMEITWLNARPWLILFVGVAVLVFTGTLYKKLG